jgi:hypothetical protein
LHVSVDCADILALVTHVSDRPEQSAVVDDPLCASIALPFHHVLFPHGFPTQIKSNDPAVIRAAELSWGVFTQRFRETPIEVRLIVSDVPSRRRPPFPVFRAQSNLLTIVADAHNFACCDLAAGFGFACLTKAATTHRDYLRFQFLEAMVYTLLDTQYLVALHAACVGIHGRGMLLVGDSGAGKSSLAYACIRRGWTYVSDDAVSIVLRKTGRTVIGNPQTLRFRPSASSLFPEIKGRAKARNGKPTVEVRTETLKNLRIAYESHVDYIVFLKRWGSEPAPPSIERLSREEALRRLSHNPWPSELAVHEDRTAAIERLLGADVYELKYRDFGPAIDLLENVVRGGKL